MLQLLDLPPEILKMICSWVTSPRYLSNLSETCTTLRTHAFPYFYNTVSLDVESDHLLWMQFRSLLDPRNEGPKHIKALKIWERPSERGASQYYQRAQMLETLVSLLLKRIPENHLACFEWCLPFDLDNEVLCEIYRYQANLTKMTLDAPSPDEPSIVFDQPMLRNLTVENLGSPSTIRKLQALLLESKTLKRLALSLNMADITAFQHMDDEFYMGWTFFESIFDRRWFAYHENDAGAAAAQPPILPAKLRYEKLVLKDMTITGVQKIFDFMSLKTLELNSVEDINQLLSYLLASSGSTYSIKKLRLVVRKDWTGNRDVDSQTATLVTQLVRHFQGLTEFVLLSEVKFVITDLLSAIEEHAETLETLVLDFYTPGKGWAYIGMQGLRQIKFKKLKELGVRLKSGTADILNIGDLARKMRCIHIRGQETPSASSSIPPSPRPKIEEIATEVANRATLVTSRLGEDMENLKLRLIVVDIPPAKIADYVGATGLTNPYNQKNCMPRHGLYHVQPVRNVAGKVVPLLTKITRGMAEDLVGDFRLVERHW